MSGWDGWAANILASFGDNVKGAAVIYCPSSGGKWGSAGDFGCDQGFNLYDQKADGKDAAVPLIHAKKFMFIRKTLDDDPVSIFKQGQDSVATMSGPSGSRVAIYIEGQKPEPVVARVVNYLKPHV